MQAVCTYVQFQAFQNNEPISPNQEVGKQEKNDTNTKIGTWFLSYTTSN